MGRFEVWIIGTRGTGDNGRKMSTFDSRADAEEFVSWHKKIDAKFPKGHYSYKIETVQEKSNAAEALGLYESDLEAW